MDGTTVSKTRTRLNQQAEQSHPGRPVSKPTIRAVAEHAKVAISTVSRVVNGGPVSEDVRQRVNLAIETLGYTPSIAAQSLVGRKANCVGLVTDSTQSRWFSQILLGIETTLAPSRKSLQLSSLMLSGSYNSAQVRSWITERRVDGLIFVRSTKASVDLVEEAHRHGLPVALIGPDLEQQAACIIRGNNVDAGRLAAEHLADLGHRRIGFAGGPEVSYDTRMRLRGASERLSERGCDFDKELVWYGASYSTEAGVQLAQKFLALGSSRRPTAVILGSDAMALGFMRAVMKAGLRVPDDVSVIGFDGIPEGEVFLPALTTVRQPTQAMAARACEVLLGQIAKPEPGEGIIEEFPVELLVRESTK
jgi:DNA-binding LacI/PurR family transcriptional regulator